MLERVESTWMDARKKLGKKKFATELTPRWIEGGKGRGAGVKK